MLIEKSERKGYSPSLVFSRSSQQPTLFEYKPRAVRGDLEEVALLSSSLLSVSIFYNFHLPYKSLLKHIYNICCIICSLLVSLVSLLRVSLFPFMQSPLLFLFPRYGFCSPNPFVCSSSLHSHFTVYIERSKTT